VSEARRVVGGNVLSIFVRGVEASSPSSTAYTAQHLLFGRLQQPETHKTNQSVVLLTLMQHQWHVSDRKGYAGPLHTTPFRRNGARSVDVYNWSSLDKCIPA
jgi:hypothetical protein